MPKNILTVGLSEIKPLVFKHGKKEVGFEIELWERIARRLKLEFQYRKCSFADLLKKVVGAKIDIAIAGITKTMEREKQFDFTNFTMNSSLMIMLSGKSRISFFGSIKNFIVEKYKKILICLGLLIVLVFIVSNVIWLVERGSGSFNNSYITGIFESLWWTVATITTVGYGDFVPSSVVGRVVAIIIMFFGIMLFGMYSAELASIITASKIKHKIESHNDLVRKRVATKSGTVAVDALEKLSAIVVPVAKIEHAYYLLKQHKVDAVVFDAPALLNHYKEYPNEFIVLDDIFCPQTYGFAVPHSHRELREKIDIEMLGMQESGEYEEIYKKWFGDKII